MKKNEEIEIDKQAEDYWSQGCLYLEKGQLDVALDNFKKSKDLYTKTKNKYWIARCIRRFGKIYSTKGQLNKALELLQESLEIFKEVENELEIAKSLISIGFVYESKSQFKLAIECIKQSKDIIERIGDLEWQGNIYIVLFRLYFRRGENKKALKQINASLKISEEINNKYIQGFSNFWFGGYHRRKGDYILALDYYRKSLNNFNEIDNQIMVAIVYQSIGWTYNDQGNLDKAQRFSEKSLNFFQENKPDHIDIHWDYLNLGDIYYQKGDSSRAFENYQKCLRIHVKNGTSFPVMLLFSLIRYYVTLDSLDSANKYLNLLHQLNIIEENKYIDQVYRLAQGLLLNRSSRLQDKARSQAFFQQIADEDVIVHSLTVTGILFLCESLLDELRAYKSTDVFEEISVLITRITEISQKQNSYPWIINSLILRSKFALVEGNLTNTSDLLKQAKLIAEEKSLGLWFRKVTYEEANLANQYEKWEELIQSNASFQERLKHSKLINYLKIAQITLTREDMNEDL